MNCLSFRRALMLDPARLAPEARAHAESCRACGELLAQSAAFEHALAQVVHVPVPEGLAERVIAYAYPARVPSRWMGIAASIAVAAVIGLAVLWPRNDELALAGIDFVVYEEAQAILDAKPSDRAVLQRVTRELGVQLPAQMGEMRYVGTCPVAGTIAHHVVVKTAHGKVTLLLFPKQVAGARRVASARGLAAAAVPAREGSVMIIADSKRRVDRIEEMLRSG